MHPKPACLRLSSRFGFRSGLCAALLLFASTMASRAQPLLAPELQFTLSSSIAAVGQDWAIYADARIINPRFWNFMEPVVLSISSPLVSPTAYGPLWFGWGSHLVTANPHGDTPGVYDVVARASTADWVAALYPGWPGPAHPLDGVLDPADRMETSITRQVTLVALNGVTAAVTTGNSSSAYHVAEGDTVTFTATMTPVNAFDLVWWEWFPGGWPPTGQTYTKVMTRWPSPLVPVVEVTATCGNSVVTVPITVYQITGVSASGPLVAAGDPLTFTATIDPPGGSPPPIEWFVNGVWQGITATGATFSTTSLPPGYYSVSAKMGGTEQYAGATVVGIGSVSLSGPDYNGTVPAGEVRYIYQNDSYTFTATAAPEGADWPLNQPQWTVNGGTTTGTNAPGTFGTLSTSISNFKTAVASCGTSGATINAVVYKCDLTMVPDDNFEGRSQSEFGIGEIIYVTNSITPSDLSMSAAGLSWGTNLPSESVFEDLTPPPTPLGFAALASVSASAAITPVGISAYKFIGYEPAASFQLWIRLPREDVASLTPLLAAAPTPVGGALIPPVTAKYLKMTASVESPIPWPAFIPGVVGMVRVGPQPTHIQFTMSSAQGLNVWIRPENVSWKEIQYREGRSDIWRSGDFLSPPSPIQRVGGVHVAWSAQNVLPGTHLKGCRVDFPDCVAVFMSALPTMVGTDETDIPMEWCWKTPPGGLPPVWKTFGADPAASTVRSTKRVTPVGLIEFGKQTLGWKSDYNDPDNFNP